MTSVRTQHHRAALLQQLLQEASEQLHAEQMHLQQIEVHAAPPSLIADEKYHTPISPGSGITILYLVLLFVNFKISATLSDRNYVNFVRTHTVTWLKDCPAVPTTAYTLE